jgi:hypothetical protein
VAVLAEAVEQSRAGLEQCERSLVAPRLQGCGVWDIAERLGCPKRAAYRIREWGKRQLQPAIEQGKGAD